MKILITSLLFIFTLPLQAQMSGVYTIDAKSSSSNTNFTSFSAATDSLVSQGLSGDVELNVTAGSGPYTEQVTISNIQGSDLYSLTIDGSNEELNLADSTNLGGYVLALDNASNTTINSLVIKQKSFTKTPTGIIIKNECNGILIENCKIYCPENVNYNSHHTEGIVIAESAYIPKLPRDPQWDDYTWHVLFRKGISKNIIIKNNEIYNPMFGIVAMYDTSRIGKNIIEGNTVVDFIYMGICSNGGNDIITKNEITRPSIAEYQFDYDLIFGIVASGGNLSGILEISDNHIHSITGESQYSSGWTRQGILSGKTIQLNWDKWSSENFNVIIKNNKIEFGDVSFVTSICTNNSGTLDIINNDITINSSKSAYDPIEGIRSMSSNGNQKISRNKIRINYSGKHHWYDLSGIKAIRANSDSVQIDNNIISINATGTLIVFTNNLVPTFEARKNGVEAIYCKGDNLSHFNIAYNTISVNRNDDDTLNTVAFRLGKGEHNITNNIASFNNMSERATFLETDTNTNWTATHNSVYADSGIIFFHEDVTGLNDLNLIDFNTRSGGTNIEANPSFVNIDSGDYRPTNTNILNGGMPIASVLVDYYGTVRLTSTPDIGAIEVFSNPLSTKTVANKELKVYPNPVNDVIRVANASRNATIDLYNTMGVHTLSGEGNSLNVSGITSGVYFIRISEDGYSTVRRVVIQ